MLALAVATRVAVAADDERADPTPIATPTLTPTPSPKRALPDYDGRANADAEAGSWALWIPRGVLMPVYLVHEYIVRRPLGALVSRAERGRWLSALQDFFSFGPEQKYMVIPTGVYDFGLRASIGVRFTGNDVIVAHHDLSAHLATGGTDWLLASLRDRYTWNRKTSIATRFDLSRRPDLLFMGIGPDVRDDDRTRYGVQRIDLDASFAHASGPAQLAIAAGVRHIGFRSAECCDDPRLENQVRDQIIEAPPGFDTPYTALYQSVALTLDSRPPRPAPGTGARISMYGQSAFDLHHDQSWGKYGGSVGGAIDLNGHQRTLHLQLGADFVDPIAGGSVPFTELATLGGANTMQAFVNGWMLGRSTAVAELGYTWPVAFLFDGTARISVGNAFGAHLDDFAAKKLRLSGDLGLTTVGSRDTGFEVILGLGTETFEQGGRIQSVRIAFGSRRGI